MHKFLIPLFLFILTLGSCIQDDIIEDFVEPVLRITTNIDTLSFNSSFQFESTYLNEIGAPETVSVEWLSSDESVISIDANGFAQALQEGEVTITAQYNNGATTLVDSRSVVVGQSTVVVAEERSGTIVTTSSYVLQGDFTIREDGNDLILEIDQNYQATSVLPGLYIYLSNNRFTTSNAYEIGAVQVFSGAHSYVIPNVGINDFSYLLYYCKPFNIKVGDGEIQ